MPINTDPRFIGRAWLTPDAPVVTPAWATWTLTYEVGAYGYDERARLKIASRFASDWGKPQFTDPKAAEYTTVRLETNCETAVASLAFEPRGQVRAWLAGADLPRARLRVSLLRRSVRHRALRPPGGLAEDRRGGRGLPSAGRDRPDDGPAGSVLRCPREGRGP